MPRFKPRMDANEHEVEQLFVGIGVISWFNRAFENVRLGCLEPTDLERVGPNLNHEWTRIKERLFGCICVFSWFIARCGQATNQE
jgi:hypothetical protein